MARTAIVSAMNEELRGLQAHLADPVCLRRGGREFWTGTLAGAPVVLVLSRIGKVAAATTVATLLCSFDDVSRVVFTGAAGGLGEGVQVGDIVVADALLQHDMDASPLFPRFEVPLSGRSRFEVDPPLASALAAAAAAMLDLASSGDACLMGGLSRAHLDDFSLVRPRVHQGLIISGDRFVSTTSEAQSLRVALPDALAVDMEGAAVAQVCGDFGIPLAVVRTISDRADDAAHVDFVRFIADVASRYAVGLVLGWLSGKLTSTAPSGSP
jgi:adenosylhomocysteine nucleosidase